MKKKIVIAGGTGFIGKYLQEQFQIIGYEVIIIARTKGCVSWKDENAIISALENAEMLINLAGKSVDCRYNEKNKAEIFSSRTETTQILGNALLKCQYPPELWLNSSTATIYRHAEDRSMTETTGEIGSGFSVEVAKAWEKSFFDFQLPQTRQVALRIAIVLGKGGGVMTPFKNLVRFGLGGKQGNGKQMFSWIHLEDLKNMILFFQTHKELQGVYNCSSPYPVKNEELMRILRNVMKVKWGLPSPTFLLTLGAILIRTETELILKSRWVVPGKLLAAGFQFKYEKMEDALQEILG
ncbi:MAG: TIGR01777 family oxidoreductase [Bacteroidia bacterium]